jgi:hypothetical protein
MSFMDQIKPPDAPRLPGKSGQPYVFGGARQWYSAKTTTDKLDAVFSQIADNDGEVRQAKYIGGRDWIIFWSKPVTR